MAKKQKTNQPTSRPPLPPSNRDFLFSYLITHESLFIRARLQVTDDKFAEDERWLLLIWQLVGDHFRENGSLPGRDVLTSKLSAEVDLNYEVLTDEEIDLCNEFLAGAFNLEEDPSHAKIAAKWLRDFLEDRLMQEVRKSLSLPQTPADIDRIFTGLAAQATQLRSLSEGAIPAPFPEGWDAVSTVVPTTPTGLPFIDRYLNGGDAPGETYGMLAPVGAGKTVAAVMLTCNRASQAYDAWVANGRTGICYRAYLFAYEDSLEEVRMRALCYLSRIPYTQLLPIMEARSYDQFSRTGRLKDYERVRYQNQLARGKAVPGEWERYQRAIRVLNQCWRCVYMGGAADAPGRGTGLVDEAAAVLAQDRSCETDVRPNIVVADYVLTAVRRHLTSTGQGYDDMRHLIVGWPGEMKHKIAVPYQCPTWSMQQLSGTANSYKPGRVLSSFDSGEAKGFPENCNFCFVMGKPNLEGRATFNCDKHRRAGTSTPIVVTVVGDQAKIVDSSHRFTIDERTNTILASDDAHRLQGGDTAAAPSRGRSPRQNGVNSVVGQQQGLGMPG